MAKIPDGKYTAAPNTAAVYEKNNKLVLELSFHLTDEGGNLYEPKIERSKRFWLTNNAGAINTKTIEQIKKFSPAWDGTDPYWFLEGENFAGCGLVELVLASRPYTNNNGGTTNWQDVDWVNPLGGSGGKQPVASADKASIMAKYGNMFKAAAGAAPKPVSAASLKKPAAPAAAPAARPAMPSRPVPAAQAEARFRAGLEGQGEVWEAYSNACDAKQMPSAARDEAWFTAIDEIAPGKNQQDFTAAEWDQVAAKLNV